MGRTKIEWADAVWNPVTGCSKVSEGCRNCYAERMAKRLAGRCGYLAEEPFRVTVHPERLEEPLKWRKARRVFVCSMGDLFHEGVPDKMVHEVWDTMAQSSLHTGSIFMLLTKRPERMKWIMENVFVPLPEILHGVSVEDQPTADERIPFLLDTPAAWRFVSYEPALGPVDFFHIQTDVVEINTLTGEYGVYRPLQGKDGPKLDWVIAGGETGPGARPAHPDWFRSVRNQCQAAGVPFFFKQWGEFQSAYCIEREAHPTDGSGDMMTRVGRKNAGRLLDGRTWDGFPERT